MLRLLLLVLFASPIVAGCAGAKPPPPAPAARHAYKARDEAEPRKPFPVHQAPPPDYGNRVVMASSR